MAELLCLEKDVDFQEKPEGQGPVCSYRDPAIFDDCTVLDNLLRSEERYPINPRYFACVQKELSVNMRRIVGRWMLEVSGFFGPAPLLEFSLACVASRV